MKFLEGEVTLENNPNYVFEPIAGTMSFDKGSVRFRIDESNYYVAFRVNRKEFSIAGDPETGNFGTLKIYDESVRISYQADDGLSLSSQSMFEILKAQIPSTGSLEVEWADVLNLTIRPIGNSETSST